MSMKETQYAIFKPKAARAQDKAVEERTDGKTKDFKTHCNIPGMCVPTRNMFEHEGCIEEERARRKKTRERSSRVKRGSNTAGKERVMQHRKETQTAKERDR